MKQTVLFHIHAIFNDHIQWAFLKLSIKEIYFYDEWLLTVSIKATNQDVKKTAKLAKKKLRKIIVHHDHEMTSQWYIVNAFFSIHHFYLCFRNLFSICSGRVFFALDCIMTYQFLSFSCSQFFHSSDRCRLMVLPKNIALRCLYVCVDKSFLNHRQMRQWYRK